MRIAVMDANIFIDLFEILWQENLFKIGLEIVTTREVFDELNEQQQESLKKKMESGQIRVMDILVAEHTLVNAIDTSRRLSFSDKTVLYIAIRDNLQILTGDQKLKKTAEKLGLQANGILWVFDKIVELNIVTHHEAADKLESLMRINSWLPENESFARLEMWKKN